MGARLSSFSAELVGSGAGVAEATGVAPGGVPNTSVGINSGVGVPSTNGRVGKGVWRGGVAVGEGTQEARDAKETASNKPRIALDKVMLCIALYPSDSFRQSRHQIPGDDPGVANLAACNFACQRVQVGAGDG